MSRQEGQTAPPSPVSRVPSLQETSQCRWLHSAGAQHPDSYLCILCMAGWGAGVLFSHQAGIRAKGEALLSPSAQIPVASPYWHLMHPWPRVL